MKKKIFATGDEAATLGAIKAGATAFFGYPITPAKEIMESWIAKAETNPNLKFLQTEDETSAGFAMIGALIAGVKAFTATAGPGTVLMQDGLSMAENMRLPVVAFLMARGGPSTGTVIYSQQEVNLACYGGNGEGLRIVYSTAGPQDLYDYAIKAFDVAWKYRFPTMVLGDGYQAKMLTNVEIDDDADEISVTPAEPFLLDPNREPNQYVNLRNTYNLEEELYELVKKYQAEYDQMSPDVVEYEEVEAADADIVIVAHGIVAAAAREAVKFLRANGIKAGMFRPITLLPFPTTQLQNVVRGKKHILIAESSLGQFTAMVKAHVAGVGELNFHYLNQPALAISIEDIVREVQSII